MWHPLFETVCKQVAGSTQGTRVSSF